MDELSKITGIENLQMEAVMGILKEGLIGCVESIVGIGTGQFDASSTRLKAAMWVVEFLMGTGKAKETGDKVLASGDWEKAFAKLYNGDKDA